MVLCECDGEACDAWIAMTYQDLPADSRSFVVVHGHARAGAQTFAQRGNYDVVHYGPRAQRAETAELGVEASGMIRVE